MANAFPEPIVEIRSGRLRGTAKDGFAVFRGIPYARAPLDDLRFRAPEAPEPWTGVRDATRFGPACPQSVPQIRLVRRLIGASDDTQSQDCLSLNVWTPAPDAARRPVMVWIHGGAFLMGTGASALYHGEHLARRGDVVVVTLNYRLGVLGFLSHPELRARGIDSNVGVRDMLRALEWVRENIGAFGGDPDNVTIFGESAGGMSVGTLLAMPAARGLFHRAILQSGAMHNVSTVEQGVRAAEVLLDVMGLTTDDVEALRHARVSELLRAQQIAGARLGFGEGGLPWQPCVDGDLLPRTALAALVAGDVARVPTLIGSNREEWRLFSLADRGVRGMDEDALLRRLARLLGNEVEAKEAIEVYRGAGRGRRSPGRLWEAIQSDRVFHHPAQRVADELAGHGVPVWRYLFSWRPPLVGARIGACHGLEIPFAFGALRASPWLRRTLGASRSARRLSRRMQDSWVAFARGARPTHERLPEWPGYADADRWTLELRAEPRLLSAPFATESAFWKPRLG